MIGITSSIEKYNPNANPICLVPVMSSANNGTIEIFASSNWDSTYTAWKAFDGVTNSDICWHTANGGWSYPQYLGFYHATKKSKVTSITIYARPGQNNRIPGNWSLQGSNDKANWYNIQDYTNSGSSLLSVNVDSYGVWYQHYRIYMKASAGGECLNIAELQFWGYYQ